MNALLAALIRIPHSVALADRSYYLVGKIGYIFGGIVHAMWMILFAFIGASNMAMMNVISVLSYVIIATLHRRHYYAISTVFTIIEVIIHQVLAVHFLGWESGFQYFLIIILPVPFIAFRGRNGLSFTLSAMALLSYLILESFVPRATPVYEIAPAILQILNVTNISSSLVLVALLSFYFSLTVDKAEAEIEKERANAEALLHNTLPSAIAQRLHTEDTIADQFDTVSVLFLDMVEFSALSKERSAHDLVKLLNELFYTFDDLTTKHRVEKIKTIGDAYMVAAGVPEQQSDDADRLIRFGFDALDALAMFNKRNGTNVELRIGVNTGNVVAGVIGKKRFIYDLWGDAVNLASRMESHGVIGKIQITKSTYTQVKDLFHCTRRDIDHVKGVGKVTAWVVDSIA